MARHVQASIIEQDVEDVVLDDVEDSMLDDVEALESLLHEFGGVEDQFGDVLDVAGDGGLGGGGIGGRSKSELLLACPNLWHIADDCLAV